MQKQTRSIFVFYVIFACVIAGCSLAHAEDAAPEPALTSNQEGPKPSEVAPSAPTATKPHYAPAVAPERDALMDFYAYGELQHLRQQSRRQRAGAIASYVIGGVFILPGMELLLTESRCEACVGREFGAGALLTFGGMSTLLFGAPLHRAANWNRRAALEFERDPNIIHAWNRTLHHATIQRKIGRSMLISGASGTLLGVAFMLAAEQSPPNSSHGGKLMSTGGLFIGAGVVLGLVGGGRVIRANRATRRVEASELFVAPALYPGGGGMSLHMGF